MLKPRQVFMTTLECARDLWCFIRKEGAHVVIVCQSDKEESMVAEISDRMAIFIHSLQKAGLTLNFGRDAMGNWSLPDRDATMRVVVAGASSAAAGKKGRGKNITRLHSTESAFFEFPELTFNAMQESVAGQEHGTEIVHESTANGVGGWYYEQWQAAVRGMNGYKAHFFRWWDHPEYRLALDPGETVSPDQHVTDEKARESEEALVAHGVSQEQLKWYRRKLASKNGDRSLMAQEYPTDPETCFLVSGRPFFDLEKIEALIRRAPQPVRWDKHGALRIWKEPVPGEPPTPDNHWQGKKPVEYVISVDTAEGESDDNRTDTSDYCAATVLVRETGEHVATLHGRFPPHEFGALIVDLAKHYNGALVGIERNNHGHAVHEAVVYAHGYTRVYRAADEKLGWHTNSVTRPAILDGLDEAIRKGFFSSPDTLFLGECRTFIITKKGRPEAAKGAHDDTVMAAAIGWKIRELPLYDSTDEVDVSTMV